MEKEIKIPKLRFKDKNGNPFKDLERIKLEEIITEVSERNKNKNIEIFSLTKKGVKIRKNGVKSKSEESYKIIKKGHFGYSPRSFFDKGFWYMKKKIGVISGSFIVFENSQNNIFLENFLNYGKQKNIQSKYSEGIKGKTLNFSDLKTLKINLPELEEQEKIAGFLSSVDECIENLREKKKKMEKYKKGILQKIFN